jgi:hypothetical protein
MMPRTVMMSTVFAVLLTSVAAAQTAPTPTPEEAPPAAVEPAESDAAAPPEMPSETAPEGSAGGPAEAMGRSDEHRRMHWRHMRAMRGMVEHGRDRGRRRSAEGASFEFSRGKGGPSIRIECADRDTTQECVDAIVPLLEMVLPDRR